MSEKDFNNEESHTAIEDSSEDIFESDVEENDGDDAEQVNGGKRQAATKKAVQSAQKKLMRKVFAFVGKLAIKLFAKLIALIIASIKIIIIVAIVVGVLALIWSLITYVFNSMTEQQNMQREDIVENNYDGNLSVGNKLMRVFYANYAYDSYFKVVDGKVYPADSPIVKDVIDKTNKEKHFKLNPDILWATDLYANKEGLYYPDRFVQAVYYDKKTFDLKQLTNEKGELVVESTAYDKKTGLPLSAKGKSETATQQDVVPNSKGKGQLVNAGSMEAVVNKDRKLSETYEPSDLIRPNVYTEKSDDQIMVRQEAATQLERLFKDAEKANFALALFSGYRSYATQQLAYNGHVNRVGQEEADKISAKPGHSEHQTGLAVDVTTKALANASSNQALTTNFGETEEGKWLAANAHKYGFVVRYPASKTAITNYSYEPWHLRYVGTGIATKLKEKGLVLEEALVQGLLVKDQIDDGELIASTQPVVREGEDQQKVKGVWDYGFAPLLLYKEYQEDQENRLTQSTVEVWDVEKQAFVEKEGNGSELIEELEPNIVWMIPKATTVMGTVENKVEQDWIDTNIPATTVKTETIEVSVRKTRPKTTVDPITLEVTTDTETYYENESRTRNVTYRGTLWRNEAIYKGEPDTSRIVGPDYIVDYLMNYETWYPDNVLTNFDFQTRTENPNQVKGLDALFERVAREFGASAITQEDFQLSLGNGADGDSGVGIGGEAGSEKVKNCMRFEEYFQTYGKRYGIDPFVLVSMCAQETGGNDAIDVSRYGSAGVGLMQIIKTTGQSGVSAMNYETGVTELFKLRSVDMHTAENTIRFAAMYLQQLTARYNYNIAMGMNAYQLGPGGFDKSLAKYLAATGKTKEQAMQERDNLSWLAYTESDGSSHTYFKNVIRYYVGTSPYAVDKNGTKYEMSGTVTEDFMEVAADTGESAVDTVISTIKGFFKGLFSFSFNNVHQTVEENFMKLFPEVAFDKKEGHVEDHHTYYKNHLQRSEAEKAVVAAFAITLGKGRDFANYQQEDWAEYYTWLFSTLDTNLSNTRLSEWRNKAIRTFGTQFSHFSNKAELSVVLQDGTGIFEVTPGMDILAMFTGTITSIDGHTVQIDAETGSGIEKMTAKLTFSGLRDIQGQVKKEIKKGDVIGKAKYSELRVRLTINREFMPPALFGLDLEFKDALDVGGSTTEGTGLYTSSGKVIPMTPSASGMSAPFLPGSLRFTSGFGWRNIGAGPEFHYGIDYAGPTGTPLLSVYDGEVIYASPMGTYGNLIKIKHVINGQVVTSVYAHLSQYNVRVGDTVARGQIIGAVGTTGRSTAPHLHFEVQLGTGHYNQAPQNPKHWVNF